MEKKSLCTFWRVYREVVLDGVSCESKRNGVMYLLFSENYIENICEISISYLKKTTSYLQFDNHRTTFGVLRNLNIIEQMFDRSIKFRCRLIITWLHYNIERFVYIFKYISFLWFYVWKKTDVGENERMGIIYRKMNTVNLTIS